MVTQSDAYICPSRRLTNGGPGVRFEVDDGAEALPAFAVRFEGRVYAYFNRCAHQALELDWNPGMFFDLDGRTIVCATHGAVYHPATGVCAGGPCNGRGLAPVTVVEQGHAVRLHDPRYRIHSTPAR